MRAQARVVGRTAIRDDRRLVIKHESVKGADYSGRKLDQLVTVGARLEGCRFERVRVDDAALGAGGELSEFIDCSFNGARMRLGSGGHTRFVRCSFRDVDLKDWFCFAVELVDCTFSGRLRKAFFNGTVPEHDREVARRKHNEFWGNDFSAMDLIDVAFRTGIDLGRQHLPSGDGYVYLADARAAVARAKSDVIGWQDLEMRQKAMPLIRTLESALEGNQQQLILRRDTFVKGRIDRALVDAVFVLLQEQGSPG